MSHCLNNSRNFKFASRDAVSHCTQLSRYLTATHNRTSEVSVCVCRACKL